MRVRRHRLAACAALLLLTLAGCGGGGSNPSSSVSSPGPDIGYAIGGTLTGLESGGQVTLTNNGADPLTLTANGSFTFSADVATGASYKVTVDSQPNDQYCAVSSGSGVMSGSPVIGVQVTCSANERVLYTFAGGNDGMFPVGGLIMDSAGDLFGTTVAGGDSIIGDPNCSNGCGTVFELSPNGSGGYSESILYRFTGTGDGSNPASALVMDSEGNLYGTTQWGGSDTYGTVFELVPNGGGGYTESILYSFTGGSDGNEPHARLLIDGAGNLYGTTYYGGVISGPDCGTGCGTVFELSHGSGGYTESILYRFTDSPDGAFPQGGLIRDSAGNLYGTTSLGGVSNCEAGCGTVFELSKSGGAYTEAILLRFTGNADDNWPFAGLTEDGAGNLYGSTVGSGCPGPCGTVYELARATGGAYTESILYSFTGGNDGSEPFGAAILDRSGNLYGATNGGTSTQDGTVYEITHSGGINSESTLHTFSGGTDGARSYSRLVMDNAGNLYGTTKYGGSSNNGVVFEVLLH